MRLLSDKLIRERLQRTDDKALRISPLLDEAQIGAISIDLRLGYDFLVSITTRKPYLNISKSIPGYRDIGSYFNVTRRDIGDRFILYPDQVVLTTTLEYISLPVDCSADLLSRSSYTRLGLSINTMVQPGFRGAFSTELFNHGNNPIELVVGSRVFQVKITELDNDSSYEGEGRRKYIGNVRPTPSRASEDVELSKLDSIWEARP